MVSHFQRSMILKFSTRAVSSGCHIMGLQPGTPADSSVGKKSLFAKGWKPAGPFSLGRWGVVINVAALAYGIFAMVLLAMPGASGDFFTDWVVLIGLGIVLGTGLVYLLVARPDRLSDAPAGDAIHVAEQLRAHRGARAEDTTVVN